MRKRVVEIYESGKGYSAISEALGLGDNSSGKSQKKKEEHLRKCRPCSPQ